MDLLTELKAQNEELLEERLVTRRFYQSTFQDISNEVAAAENAISHYKEVFILHQQKTSEQIKELEEGLAHVRQSCMSEIKHLECAFNEAHELFRKDASHFGHAIKLCSHRCSEKFCILAESIRLLKSSLFVEAASPADVTGLKNAKKCKANVDLPQNDVVSLISSPSKTVGCESVVSGMPGSPGTPLLQATVAVDGHNSNQLSSSPSDTPHAGNSGTPRKGSLADLRTMQVNSGYSQERPSQFSLSKDCPRESSVSGDSYPPVYLSAGSSAKKGSVSAFQNKENICQDTSATSRKVLKCKSPKQIQALLEKNQALKLQIECLRKKSTTLSRSSSVPDLNENQDVKAGLGTVPAELSRLHAPNRNQKHSVEKDVTWDEQASASIVPLEELIQAHASRVKKEKDRLTRLPRVKGEVFQFV